MTQWIDNLDQCNGLEVRPGITLIGTPTEIEGQWRCLANVYGALAIVELKITVHQKQDQA